LCLSLLIPHPIIESPVRLKGHDANP
jgi:hypothetical protein